jgi:hypothetical protein
MGKPDGRHRRKRQADRSHEGQDQEERERDRRETGGERDLERCRVRALRCDAHGALFDLHQQGRKSVTGGGKSRKPPSPIPDFRLPIPV